MKKKLWIDLFFKVAVIFVVFVLLLAFANSTLLVSYFTYKQEHLLAEKSAVVARLDHEDTDALDQEIWAMREDHNFDIEIYYENGNIIYTTNGPQMQGGSSRPSVGSFNFVHERLEVIKSKTLDDGAVILTAKSAVTGDEYLVCRRNSYGIVTELRTQISILENSAGVAGEFVTIIAALCFLGSLLWIFIFARKFSKPISEMSSITENMANLDFSRKVSVQREDEIGRLGESINHLSDKLDTSLSELRASNAKLRDEIELERQLDVMRRGFVANVSHELKTPLAIISGYAEGLKLNINSASKDDYCDTIIDETERMNRLVLSILELSKYESAQIKPQNTEFDISQMAADMLNRIFKGKEEVETACEIPENTLVFADAVQTEQIFKSYLENAAAHVKEGGRVRIFCENDGETLKISVFNSGEPVDPEIMPHIWQSFYRGNQSHTRSGNRFGLGLSIVSAIVKAQGQSCGVYNTEEGVCFWFTVSSGQLTVDSGQ